MNINKQLLPQVKNKISYIYIEMAKITQKEYSIICIRKEEEFVIPIAQISCMILGIGTSITQEAIKIISEYGCSIVWMGRNLNYFYTYGIPLTNSSKNILIQTKCYESKTLQILVIRKMYEIRYPNEKLKSRTKEELLGIEGKKMQDFYITLANKYNVEWKERIYHIKDFDNQDDINKAITISNQFLYSITTAVIVSLGFSTAIGFIHTGKMMSFVYDIADLYKETFTIPIAFEIISKKDYEPSKLNKIISEKLYEKIVKEKLLKRMVKDISKIFTLKEYDIKCEIDIKEEIEFEKI